MRKKVARSPEDLEDQFREQIAFLERSCASFDNGFEGEAKRIATTLRILFHDTKNSKSLLKQLNKKNLKFLDTALPVEVHSRTTHAGLVFLHSGPLGTRFVAMLDDAPTAKWISFSSWWESDIFVDSEHRLLSRSKIVLTAANQDGGAHVDSALDEDYYALSRKNSLRWFFRDGERQNELGGPEKAAIRQIAHETLKSLNPAYSKKSKQEAGVWIGGVTLEVEDSPIISGTPSPGFTRTSGRKVGRNEICSCGSGLKYKRCCGKIKSF